MLSKFWSKFKKVSKLGQTSVEYILLLAAMITIITSLLSGVRDRLISRQTPCPAADKSIGCTISRAISSFGASAGVDPERPSFRFFSLR